ncbi:hypothetical protein M405DRAFT_888942 [Rhizopogon salebrosus TDB-379]|nr:hypothetical protein M405DRAFT_888942 [Rhizopogon salebrosus TDB-379]
MPSVVMSIMQGPLCGTLATMLLYGIICMQTFHYWQAYENDRKILKCLVTSSEMILETAHTALSIHSVEHYLILNFGDVTTLEYAVWCAYFCPYANTISCFVWRILQLSQKRWIAVCFVIFATVRCGKTSKFNSKLFRYTMWKTFRARVYPTMVVAWVLSVLCDSSIAVALCIYLRKRRTGMKRRESSVIRTLLKANFSISTNGILNRLLLYTINTGAPSTSMVHLPTNLNQFLGLPTSLAFIAFVQVQSKLYAISFLASLNTRKSTLEGTNQSGPATGGIALSLLPNFTMLKASRQKPSRMVCIFVLHCVAGLKSDVLVAD